MHLSIFLSFLASFLQIVAFVIYNKQLIRGLSKPKITSWGLWAFLSFLSTASYIKFTGDIVKGIMPLTISSIVIFTFFYALHASKFSKLNKLDITVLLFGIISIFVWWLYRSAVSANLILQLSAAIAYIPTLSGVWKHASSNEKFLPWFIWSIAYILAGAVVILRWTAQYEALVYPFMHALLSASVGVLVFRRGGPPPKKDPSL